MTTGAAIRASSAIAGAIMVAAAPLSQDDAYPKGFYLRVVDGQAWLRGYRCDDTYVFAAVDEFAFCRPESGGQAALDEGV